MVKYEQERVGDWIQLNSGKRFFPLDPRPEDIDINDIAHALSNLARFTGHGDRFYSVGEHSIHCARIARRLGLTPLQQLFVALHDSSEHIVNDIARPLKQYMHDYKQVEDNIMSVIWEGLGLPQPTKHDYHLVKLIDNTMLVHEIHQLMKRTDFTLDVETVDIHVDLSRGYKAGESKYDFLITFYDLMDEYREWVANNEQR